MLTFPNESISVVPDPISYSHLESLTNLVKSWETFKRIVFVRVQTFKSLGKNQAMTQKYNSNLHNNYQYFHK